jgi:predicted nucleic-acid-binding Zn-ribbon protein
MGLKSGVCPQCGSDEIYEDPQPISNPAGRNSLFIKYTWYYFAQAQLMNLVCANCGYVENYVADKKFLPEIRKFWKPYNREKRKNEE